MWDQMGLPDWLLYREQMGLPYSALVLLLIWQVFLLSLQGVEVILQGHLRLWGIHFFLWVLVVASLYSPVWSRPFLLCVLHLALSLPCSLVAACLKIVKSCLRVGDALMHQMNNPVVCLLSPLSYSDLAVLKISCVLLLNFLTGRTDEVGKLFRKMLYSTSGSSSYNYMLFLSQKVVLSTALCVW